MSDLKVKMLLDSGAFGAWSRKDPLDVDLYIEYLKEHEELLWGYVNLDVIVGTFGQPRTFKQLDDGARVGYENLGRIKKHGLKPMPVYHQNESLDWLARMIEDGEPYIGLSSAKDLWAKDQAKWLDEMFSLLTDREGRPLIKTHGFGITNPDLVRRYPWYSVDSTTWSLCAGYGQIIIPGEGRGGTMNYLKPLRIVVSGVAHRAGSNQSRQFEGFVHLKSNKYYDHCKTFLEEVCGVTIAQVRYGPPVRRRCMLHYFMGLMDALKDVRYDKKNNEQSGLMAHVGSGLRVRKAVEKLKPVKISHPNIMFATTLSREWSHIMNDVGANTRLLSYYELKGKKPGTLAQYIKTGSIGKHKKILPKLNRSDTEHFRNFSRMNVVNRMQKGEQDA